MGGTTWSRALVFALLGALGLGGWSVPGAGADASPRASNLAAMRRLVHDVRRATNAPGAIVAIQRDAHAPMIVARGTRDRRAGGPLQPDDPFIIASVSKAYTATVMLALVKHGALRLDDRVVRYVPGWDPRITIRELLNHTSGLPSWGNKDDPPDSQHAALESADLSRRFTMAESLEPVRAMPLLAKPGAATHYSNANTLLAGLVIEAVTKRPLADAYRHYVLRPLHLDSTAYLPQQPAPRPPIPGVLYVDDAHRTEIDTSQYPLDSLLTLDGPSVAMVSDTRRHPPLRAGLPPGRLPDPSPRAHGSPNQRRGRRARHRRLHTLRVLHLRRLSTREKVPPHRVRRQRPRHCRACGVRPEVRHDGLRLRELQ